MIYNRGQIAAAWCQAGGDAARSTMAAAVALAESGGRTDSVSADGRAGLWMAGNGPSGPAGDYLNRCVPVIAAKEAIDRSNNGQDWSQFPGYKNGAFLQFLPGRGRVPENTPEHSGKWSAFFQIGDRYLRVELRRHSGQAEAAIMIRAGRAPF